MKCVLCFNKKFKIISKKLRHEINRNIVQCTKCSLVSIENPTNKNIDYTKKEYRKKHSPIINKSMTAKELSEFFNPIIKKRIDRTKNLFKKNMNVLEIGCSTGNFLNIIKPFVKNCAGIELEPSHVKFAREKFQLKIYNKPIEEINFEQKFDLIIMFQVFEHISNPIEFLLSCKKHLKTNGQIYVEVPNIDDVLISVYSITEFKNFYYREPHRYYYSKKTLKQIMKKSGIKGESKTIQEYSLFNHIHWITEKSPQHNQQTGYSELNWNYTNKNKIKKSNMLKKWFKKINKEYQKKIEDEGLAEHLNFLGTV